MGKYFQKCTKINAESRNQHGGGHSVKKKKPYDRQVFRAAALIMQFGINMLVPICLMSAAGIWLDKHFGTDFWMILLFCMGAVAGGQNVYRMARTIYEDGDDKHTKKDK